MKVEQIYPLVNEATKEALGEEAVVQEDLSNLVDIGTSIFGANAVDKYVKSLINHIGKVIFVNRKYAVATPSVLMDSWEFGSVLQKIRAELPDATENESWELEDGQSYDPNIFYRPTVASKFYNSKVTFEIPMSFTERQVKQSFDNVEQLNAFVSMLYNEVDKSMTVKLDGLVMRTINNFIAQTMHDSFADPTSFSGKTSATAINLLYEYNQQYSESLTYDKALTDKDFIRFAIYRMGVTEKRLARMSKMYNLGGKERFTSADKLHTILHADFASASRVFLQSDTYNPEFTALPSAEIVPYWQGSGTDYALSSTSEVHVSTAGGDEVDAKYIIGVMFDRDALGVTNMDKRVTSNYNPKAEFYNNWFKYDAGYYNDFDENFVVFYMA